MTRVLNLYAGLGGNRALWPAGVQVTAVESDPRIAAAYRELWPQDVVVVGDAHEFLLAHYRDGWDLIWASPPCQSHTRLMAIQEAKGLPRYPDMALWQEIVFLQAYCPAGTFWVVENVIPYYEPFIRPSVLLDRHLFWLNFPVSHKTFSGSGSGNRICVQRKPDGKGGYQTVRQLKSMSDSKFEAHLGIRLPDCISGWRLRRQVLRNCTHPLIGKYVYDSAFLTDDLYEGTLFDNELLEVTA